MTVPARTIDDVIAGLDTIIDDAIAREARIGYFAALYRKVTVRIRDKIAARFFEDGPRMERLDVIFANRYLTAVQARRAGRSTTESWAYAFDATEDFWPIVLQHLLLGMNAHINLDLGVAAAETVAADELPGLKGDFDRINTVLADLVGEVQDELAEIWTTLRLFNRYLGGVDSALINFSMEQARNHAWSVAERLAPLHGGARSAVIMKIDRELAEFARVIRHPGPLLGTVLNLVRVGERGSVRKKIEILM